MNHRDDAIARGACPNEGCTDDRKATWHHNVPCPFSPEGDYEKAAS